MNNIIKALLVVSLLFVTVPSSADMFDIFGQGPVPAVEAAPALAPQMLFEDPTNAVVMKNLLTLVVKDLQLCLTELGTGKDKSYLKTFPAMGHLNHALTALNKVNPPKAFKPVVREIGKRISCAKFYLVMYCFEEVSKRITSVIEFIGTLG